MNVFIKQAKALVITGTALSKSPSREATFKAVELARKNGLVVFFDIDYRPYTWQSEEIASITYHMAAEKCHVIIGTREEFEVMECYTGIAALSDTEIAHKWLGKGADIVIIKHGEMVHMHLHRILSLLGMVFSLQNLRKHMVQATHLHLVLFMAC